MRLMLEKKFGDNSLTFPYGYWLFWWILRVACISLIQSHLERGKRVANGGSVLWKFKKLFEIKKYTSSIFKHIFKHMFKEKNISNSPGKPKHEALKNVIAQQNLMY